MLLDIFESLAKVSSFACIITGLIFVGYTFYIIWERKRYAHISSPPYKSFYLGHGTELAKESKNGTIPKLMIHWAEEYGPIFYFTIFHKVIIVLTTLELAKEILTNSKYGKSKAFADISQKAFGERMMGKGLATNIDHEDWKKKRQLINSAFHNSTMDRLTNVFNDAADRLITELESVSDTGKLVSMLEQMHRTTLDVIGQAAFSEDILNEKEGNFIYAIYMALKSISISFQNPIFHLLPWNKLFVNEVKESVFYLRRRARKMLETRIQYIAEGRETPEDILDILVRSMVGNFPMEEIVDEIITMFIAGQETTANVISFLLIEVGRNPELMKSIRNEVDSIAGTKRFISQSDVAQLDWITAALKETLRMYPPAGGTVRDSCDHVEVIAGHKIPACSQMLISFFAVQYLNIKDGFTFRPERFLAESDFETGGINERGVYDLDLVPKMYSQLGFSLGQRSCIGRNFAYLEAKILVTKLFQHFNFKPNPEETMQVEDAGTFKPKDGAKMFIYKRQ